MVSLKNSLGTAVFSGMGNVVGEVLFEDTTKGCKLTAHFTQLPAGIHGFHIHENGDLRGEGCMAACSHFHKGPPVNHGGPPSTKGERHTGDLGNINSPSCKKTFLLHDVRVHELYGRTLIVHEDEDDLGVGSFEDSKTTGHSGKRIACAIIGRGRESLCKKPSIKTRKLPQKK